jgi:sensor histidine kinase YesM
VLGGLAYARHLLLIEAPHGNILTDVVSWMTGYYPWVILSPFVFWLEQRYPLRRASFLKHLLYIALVGAPVTYAAHELTLGFNGVAQFLFHLPPPQPNAWWSPIQRCEFLLNQALYWSTVAAACIIRNFIERHNGERRAAQLALEKSQLEGSLRQAELETLRMRLNPHFLFNSLQNISTLTQQNPEIASQMLTKLGDLLRSTLRKGTQQETTLATEIELTKAYVAVEQMRFGDRLSILFDVDPAVERAFVPSFLLQPLVENAITHGLRGDQQSGVIWIRAMRRGNQLMLTVSDNGSGPPKEKLADLEMGIGLGSTCDRLAHVSRSAHNLDS